MPTVLVTGSNRGLGLEWVRQYADLEWSVLATCRKPAEAEQLNQIAAAHGNVTVYRLDVTNPEETQALSVALQGEPVDILINNAGIYLEKYTAQLSLLQVRYDDWMHTFEVNTLGAMRVTEALLDNIAASDRRLVVTMTSHMGSIAEIESPGSYPYRSSKAALNAAMVGLSLELRDMGIGVLLMHPGWVLTRMGGPDAPLKPAESVRSMRRLIDRFATTDTGRFFRYDGSEIPW